MHLFVFELSVRFPWVPWKCDRIYCLSHLNTIAERICLLWCWSLIRPAHNIYILHIESVCVCVCAWISSKYVLSPALLARPFHHHIAHDEIENENRLFTACVLCDFLLQSIWYYFVECTLYISFILCILHFSWRYFISSQRTAWQTLCNRYNQQKVREWSKVHTGEKN